MEINAIIVQNVKPSTMTTQNPPPQNDPIANIVPYKNRMALISYYLGVFSIIPCLGVLLALASIPLGIMGLNFAKKHPDSKGTVHAWIGIIVGSVVLLGHAVVLILPALFA